MLRSAELVPRSRDPGAGGADARVARFDLTERAVHWTTAFIGMTLILTGAILYVPSFSVAFGRRLLVEDLHLYIGLCVFAPTVLAAATRAGRQLRRDLSQMNRMTAEEGSWLLSGGRRGRKAVGKFNPGQKLNTYALGSLLAVLLGTGIVLRWGNSFPVGIRTGATFVHDLGAFAFAGLVLGHIGFALTHPVALRSMVTGWVPRRWLARHAPSWVADEPTHRSPTKEATQ